MCGHDSEFQIKYFGFEGCHPNCFYRGQWSSQPVFLWLFKLFAMLYWCGWVAFSLTPDLQPFDRFYRDYTFLLTNWGVVVILLYLVMSFCVVTHWMFGQGSVTTVVQNVRTARVRRRNAQEQEEGLRWYHKLTWMLQTVAVDSALLITVIYWSFLDRSVHALSINNHILNSVVMVTDLLIAANPVRLLHCFHTVMFFLLYGLFTLILHGAGVTSAIYSFLDWRRHAGTAAGAYVLCALIAAPLAHAIAWLVFKLRASLRGRCGGCGGGEGVVEPVAQVVKTSTVVNMSSMSRHVTRLPGERAL